MIWENLIWKIRMDAEVVAEQARPHFEEPPRDREKGIERCPLCGTWYHRTEIALCQGCIGARRRCRWCDRPMKNNSDTHKDLLAYGGRGYCMTHYRKVNDAGTEDILEADLDAAVEAYWRNRTYVLAGVQPRDDA